MQLNKNIRSPLQSTSITMLLNHITAVNSKTFALLPIKDEAAIDHSFGTEGWSPDGVPTSTQRLVKSIRLHTLFSEQTPTHTHLDQ